MTKPDFRRTSRRSHTTAADPSLVKYPYAMVLLLGFAFCPGCNDMGCHGRMPAKRREVDNLERREQTKPVVPSRQDEGRQEEGQRLRKQIFAGSLESDSNSTEETTEEEERDFEAELRNIAGNPIGCLKARSEKEAPETIRISLEAVVTQNGVISRSYVGSPSLSQEELDCINRRIEYGRFNAPVENAPRTVRATIEIRQAKKTSQ